MNPQIKPKAAQSGPKRAKAAQSGPKWEKVDKSEQKREQAGKSGRQGLGEKGSNDWKNGRGGNL